MNEENEELDPGILEFLDAKNVDEQLDILSGLRERITDRMIDTFAAAMELEVADGRIENRYDDLRSCLLMKKRYEKSRERR